MCTSALKNSNVFVANKQREYYLCLCNVKPVCAQTAPPHDLDKMKTFLHYKYQRTWYYDKIWCDDEKLFKRQFFPL